MKIQIRFDGPPAAVCGRFVEVEDAASGASISIGDWVQDGDFWLLVFDSDNLPRSPIGIILHCPLCGTQHVDAPEPERGWTNPPHRSHLCHGCGRIWRPSDSETTGVAAIATKGSRDAVGAPVYAIAELSIAARATKRHYDSFKDVEGDAFLSHLEKVWQDAQKRLEDAVDALDSELALSAG